MEPIFDRRSKVRRNRYPSRRRFPRVILSFDGFFESRRRMLIGKLYDISLRGAFIRTCAPDAPGTPATIRLELPGYRTLMKVQAEVIHSVPDAGRRPPGMGVRFVELQQWQLKRLASVLLARAGYRGLGVSCSHGRMTCSAT